MNTRVAIVTGAGSGIGKCTAIALRREGYAVVLAGRRVDELKATLAEMDDFDSHALIVPTDVRQPESVRALFDDTRKRFGRLDLLFNNAGIGSPPLPIEEVAVEQWRSVVDTNLTGTFLCLQEAFKLMKHQTPRGGRIINNGSISAHTPRPNFAAYTATKHAITGLTKAAALEGRGYDIACGQIDIGNAATNIAYLHDGFLQASGTMAVEPTFEAEHVARAVIYMAGLPLDANVLFMTVMATKMPYVGRG
jgi:NAD(P)-dependent dehydrogenase (short-subunit alcohol dehydrogenase family)